MDIEVTEIGKLTVVAPVGDIDMAVADELRVRLASLVEQGRVALILDLGRVMYIDSSGLGAVVAAMKQARASGGDLALCALEDDVRAVFQMTRLDTVLAVHPTRERAVAASTSAGSAPPGGGT